jgi:hypothetical protein
MRISGLSNQWKTRDGLFGMYAVAEDPDPGADPVCNECSRITRELLLRLEQFDGPDIWIGTSHRMLNFNLRDTTHQFDHIPSFLTVVAFDVQRDPPKCGYRVGFSLTGADWEEHDIIDVQEAADMILRLLRDAGV